MKYPRFKGDEPCTQVGADLFFSPPGSQSNYVHLKAVKAVCDNCAMIEPCLEYALHTSVVGVWGGTTENERLKIRRERNIIANPV
jgi:WhiB family redox-sensing transcriptional regulator